MKCCDIEGRAPRTFVKFPEEPLPVTPITCAYIPEVKAEMRLNLGGRALYIGDVENVDEANRTLVLLCEEKVT